MVLSESSLEGRRVTRVVYRNVLSREFETRDINNSIDVRKIFKIDGLVVGYYQLLVKLMHKKVLKGTK